MADACELPRRIESAYKATDLDGLQSQVVHWNTFRLDYADFWRILSSPIGALPDPATWVAPRLAIVLAVSTYSTS